MVTISSSRICPDDSGAEAAGSGGVGRDVYGRRAALTLQVQDWRYGKQLTEQAGLHQDDLTAFSNAAATQVRADQDKRLALEQRLSVSDQTHHKELTNAQTNQARLCHF